MTFDEWRFLILFALGCLVAGLGIFWLLAQWWITR